MKAVLTHIDDSLDARLEQLIDWVKIPSVSTDPGKKEAIRDAALHLERDLDAIGLETEILETPGHPCVYAEKQGPAGSPTVLFYGHYDVQPADPLDEWTTPPFEPVVRDGRLYGRGVADDKGQVHAQVKAIESLLETRGKLPVTVKLLIEGEEEIGSKHLEKLVRDHKSKLACDVVVISDTPMLAEGYPSLCLGLRGLAYGEIVVTGPRQDLHSGAFGGGVANPANVLASILSGLKNERGEITIPGFHDKVVPLTSGERKKLRDLPFDEKKWLALTGSPAVTGEEGYTTLERIWARPTLDVNGMLSGYTGPGAKTIVPATARAKISSRLVPNQDPHEILSLIEKRVLELAPPSVKVEFLRHHGGKPYLGPSSHPAFEAARKALATGFDTRAVEIREGGTIPVVPLFAEILEAPCVLMGFGLPDQNIHGPDENLRVSCYRGGIRSIAAFLDELPRTMSK